MTRLGWTQGNSWLCRRTNSPMGMHCSRCPYNPLQPQHNRTGTKWTARRQMRQPAQLPGLIQLFFSSSPPLVRQRTKQRRPKGRKVRVPGVERTGVRAFRGAITGRQARAAEHPARHGGTYHTTPAIIVFLSSIRCIQFCCCRCCRNC